MKLKNKLFTDLSFWLRYCKIEVKTFFGESKISKKTLCQIFSKLETFMLLYSRIYINIHGFVITRYLQYSWKPLTKLRCGCLYTLSPESISPARKLGLALLRICLKFHNHVKRHNSICTINVPETTYYRN